MSGTDIRASDAARERVAAILQHELGIGRFDTDEYSQRVAAAHAARTIGELAPLTGDLPAATTAETPPSRSGRKIAAVTAAGIAAAVVGLAGTAAVVGATPWPPGTGVHTGMMSTGCP
jgi:alkylhydroperoxidase family enzyme